MTEIIQQTSTYNEQSIRNLKTCLLTYFKTNKETNNVIIESKCKSIVITSLFVFTQYAAKLSIELFVIYV